MPNVLVVNNHDSFVFNLVQIVRETPGFTPIVIDEKLVPTSSSLFAISDHVLLSPGPSTPSDFPGLMYTLEHYSTSHNILGVCLGMQAIAEYYGGSLKQLPRPKHGHTSQLQIVSPSSSPILADIPTNTPIGRYHSWVVDPDTFPSYLHIDAYDDEGNIAVLHHRELPIHGVQFHPESIMTSEGRKMIRNWLTTK